jgi:hypothetical protein
MVNSKLSPADSVRFINSWLYRNGYAEVFAGNVDTILRENRRVTRASNVQRYGRIPYWTNQRGRAFYEIEDLQTFCNDRLKPICTNKLAIKLAKAASARYYTPHITAPADDDGPVVSDAMLNRLLADIDAPDQLDELLNELDGCLA